MELGTLLLLLLVLLFVMGVVLSKNLLRAAVSLALASVTLSAILFMKGAWMAAFFELSVCAGLITVLFVSTLSLTRDSDTKTEARVPGNIFFFMMALMVFLAVDVYAVKWIFTHLPRQAPAVEGASFAKTFWETRTTDIIGQVALLLAGVFAILALFKRKAVHHGGKHD